MVQLSQCGSRVHISHLFLLATEHVLTGVVDGASQRPCDLPFSWSSEMTWTLLPLRDGVYSLLLETRQASETDLTIQQAEVSLCDF